MVYYTITPLNSVASSSFQTGRKNNCFNGCCPPPLQKRTLCIIFTCCLLQWRSLSFLLFPLKNSLRKIFRKIRRQFACAKSSLTHIDGHTKNRILFKKEGTSCKQYVFKAQNPLHECTLVRIQNTKVHIICE